MYNCNGSVFESYKQHFIFRFCVTKSPCTDFPFSGKVRVSLMAFSLEIQPLLENIQDEENANESDEDNSYTELKVPPSQVNSEHCPTEYKVDLPEGKIFHIFVSHSGDDSEEVWELVKELEKRYKIRCLYADRDFQPGKDITDNIQESIEVSMKTLLMLSPSYLNSGYCWFEQKVAFQKSITNRQNCLIPLILKPFEGPLPSALTNLTYIDAEKENDLAARIYEGLIDNSKYICIGKMVIQAF